MSQKKLTDIINNCAGLEYNLNALVINAENRNPQYQRILDYFCNLPRRQKKSKLIIPRSYEQVLEMHDPLLLKSYNNLVYIIPEFIVCYYAYEMDNTKVYYYNGIELIGNSGIEILKYVFQKHPEINIPSKESIDYCCNFLQSRDSKLTLQNNSLHLQCFKLLEELGLVSIDFKKAYSIIIIKLSQDNCNNDYDLLRIELFSSLSNLRF